ncbi:phage portal protein [bacterium]|nr:phage portal protein [bacterium]
MWREMRDWFAGTNTPSANTLLRAEWAPKNEIPSSPLSMNPRDERLPFWLSDDGIIPPPGMDPRALFPLLRSLRDYIPDVSAGVWAWVRLCSTPMSRELSKGDEEQAAQAERILSELDERIFGGHRDQEPGVEALMRALFLSAFTYGAFCGEVVLTPDRRRIEQFIVIDPATIRFRLDAETRRYLPYQLQSSGEQVALNPASFFYYGLDTDGLSPYGRSPLLALPLAVKLQQQMLQDMAKAQHNAGYPTFHFKIKAAPQERGESPADYNKRLAQAMNDLRNEVSNKRPDSNLLTYDNVDIEYIGPNGRSQQWTESLQAIGEQVVSALHLAPFMIGRNWGSTESWGSAQYQLIVNNARSVQNGAKRLADWLMNLELALNGSVVKAEAKFAPHHHIDLYDRARSFQTLSETVLMLQEKGLYDEDAAKRRIDSFMRLV